MFIQTIMGHSHTSMGGVAFQETLIRGTEWAATGKVTFPPVTSDLLPVDRAAYREVKDIKSLTNSVFLNLVEPRIQALLTCFLSQEPSIQPYETQRGGFPIAVKWCRLQEGYRHPVVDLCIP